MLTPTGTDARPDEGRDMHERTNPRSPEGFSLVTGPGRAPLTRRQVEVLARLISERPPVPTSD